MVSGVDGVGKSTLAAQAPKPIFLGSEDGTNNLDVTRFPIFRTLADVNAAIDELIKEKHEFETLVIDSVDWLEPVIHAEVCARHNAKSIELAAGGYGKGYVEALNEWSKLTQKLALLRETRKMNIVLIAHVEVARFNDPNLQSEYDRYQLKLNKKSAALLREFVDCVLFANYETFTKKDGSKTRAFGDGVRVIYTERRPGFDAKNRFSLPFQMPMSWPELDAAITSSNGADPEAVRRTIAEMLEEISDETLKTKVIDAVKSASDNVQLLEAIKSKLAIRIGEQG